MEWTKPSLKLLDEMSKNALSVWKDKYTWMALNVSLLYKHHSLGMPKPIVDKIVPPRLECEDKVIYEPVGKQPTLD